MGVWFFHQLQLSVAPALLHSPHWKQSSMKPVILERIARAERFTTHVDVNLWRLPPCNFSHQKSDYVRKTQFRCLRLLCVAAASSEWQKLFRLTFSVHKKVEISTSRGEKMILCQLPGLITLTTTQLENVSFIYQTRPLNIPYFLH